MCFLVCAACVGPIIRIIPAMRFILLVPFLWFSFRPLPPPDAIEALGAVSRRIGKRLFAAGAGDQRQGSPDGIRKRDLGFQSIDPPALRGQGNAEPIGRLVTVAVMINETRANNLVLVFFIGFLRSRCLFGLQVSPFFRFSGFYWPTPTR